MKQLRALVLFSGGLDSILAAKILMEQGIKAEGVFFKSYFFGPEKAQKAAKKLGIKLKVIDFSKEHLKMVKKPKYGYGKNMNPCIDCHLLMLKTAKRIMDKEKFDFVATGEVLGERPMSQNRSILNLLAKESGLSDRLLRPLSAKLLAVTGAEKKGLVKRDKLIDIQGRSRKKQLALAKKWKIDWFPSPAGGCLLTDPEFAKRLRELLSVAFRITENDMQLLKIGRHFWLSSPGSQEAKIKIIVGRNHQENLKLKRLRTSKDILIELKDLSGPTTLIRSYGGKISQEAIDKAKELAKFYSSKARNQKDVKFKLF